MPAEPPAATPPASRHAPSLGLLSVVAVLSLGALALGTIGLLTTSALLTTRTVTSIARESDSLYTASELQLQLLSYQRNSHLLALTGEDRLSLAMVAQRGSIEILIQRAYEQARLEEELRLVREADLAIQTYFDERDALLERGLGIDAQIIRSRKVLDRCLIEIEALRQINRRQIRLSRDRALSRDRLANAAALGASILLLIALGGTLYGVRGYLLRPILAFRATVERNQRGELEARAEAQGPRELRDIARAFNQMSDTIAQQRRAQLIFLAGVAHDLRNPLSALRASIQTLDLLRSTKAGESTALSSDKLDATLAIMDRQVDRCVRMVGDLLDATRIEAGQLDLQPQRVDLRKIIEDVVGLYAPTSPRHRLDLSSSTDPVLVEADPARLEQVIGNLINNAIKYSPDGGLVSIRVSQRRHEACISVSDEGVGIAASEIPSLFTPFRPVAPGQERLAGARLGLSVTLRIVRAHGGRIDVRSQLGFGSTFTVYLPLADQEPAEA